MWWTRAVSGWASTCVAKGVAVLVQQEDVSATHLIDQKAFDLLCQFDHTLVIRKQQRYINLSCGIREHDIKVCEWNGMVFTSR